MSGCVVEAVRCAHGSRDEMLRILFIWSIIEAVK